jgi:hypothetical protein
MRFSLAHPPPQYDIKTPQYDMCFSFKPTPKSPVLVRNCSGPKSPLYEVSSPKHHSLALDL